MRTSLEMTVISLKAAANPILKVIVFLGVTAWFSGLENVQKRIEKEYNQAYEEALSKYGDVIVSNGTISTEEENQFNRRIFEDRGVVLLPENMPVYKDGSEVPKELATDWIRNYVPSD